MRWVFGKGQRGQVIDEIDGTWSEFVETLHIASQRPNDPTAKDDGYWVAAFLLKAGATHRTIEDVDRVASWLGMDYDHGNLSLSDIRLKFFGQPIIAHTTASSIVGNARWRVLMQLDREYTTDEHPRLWRYFADRFPQATDGQVKNVNRFYYVPQLWHGADNIFFADTGKPANVDSILAMMPTVTDPLPITDGRNAPKAAPSATEIISHHMLNAACGANEGGRLFRIMCAAAKRYRLEGWQLTAADLADAGRAASAIFAPGKHRTEKSLHHEAQRAINWAANNFQPQSPLEKMRARILWERREKY